MSSSGISVGGLVSGLDTNAIIDGLYNIERGKIQREETKRQAVETQKEAFAELLNRVETLSVKAGTLVKDKDFNLFAATTNDDELAKVSADENALPGSYELVVQQLATTTKVASNSFSAVNVGLGLAGSFEISRSKSAIANNPSKTATTVSLSANDSLKDIAAKINAAEGAGVKASLLTLASGENRLVLTSVDEGSEGFFLKDLGSNVLNGAGLGILDDRQAARSEFSFLKHTGGAADLTTTFGELATGIGANNLSVGDSLEISGTNADGDPITTNFAVNPASTLQDLVTHLQSVFGPDTSVNLSASGEIVLRNEGAGVGAITLDMSLQSTTGGTLALGGSKVRNLFSNALTEGTKSFYMLDGMAVSSQSNNDKSTVLGTTFHLLKADPTSIVKLDLKQDTDGVKAKIRGFIEEFNSLLKFIDEKSKVDVGKDEKDENGKVKVKSKGPLAGDSFVRRLRSQLQMILTNPISELEDRTQYTSLSRIGITTSRTDGKLVIDEEKLSTAISTDLDGIRRLFAATGFSDNPAFELGRYDKNTSTGTYAIDTADDSFAGAQGKRIGDTLSSSIGNSKGLTIKAPLGSGTGNFTFVRGIASQLKHFVEQSNDYVDGIFKKTSEGFDKRLNDFDDRIARLEEQVASFRLRMVKQFSSLEQSMQRMQSQSSAFMNQISSFSR